MNLLKKYIRKEIKGILHEKTMRIPQILKSFLEDNLELSPTGHYIKDIKFPVSTPPSYEIILVNDETFEMIFQPGPDPTFVVNINHRPYDLSITDEKNTAQKEVNDLLTGEKFSPGEEEEIGGDEDFGVEPEAGDEEETEPEEEI
jgi:hypothetical protein